MDLCGIKFENVLMVWLSKEKKFYILVGLDNKICFGSVLYFFI